jgi:mono/diheme cytochrome c family protein
MISETLASATSRNLLEECVMNAYRKALFAVACTPLFWIVSAPAQPAPAQPAAEHQGLTIVRAKCFQCHTDAMWRDQRLDGRGWEATLYRMVGRGALWTTEEIKLMSEYLGTDFGPNLRPTESTR